MFDLLNNYSDLGLYALRLAIGIVFIYHAWPKLKNSKMMAAAMGMANMAAMVFILGLVEMLAGLGLIFGFLVFWSALALSLVMIGAILIKITKWHISFSPMDKTGWEFDLVLLAANIAILLNNINF